MSNHEQPAAKGNSIFNSVTTQWKTLTTNELYCRSVSSALKYIGILLLVYTIVVCIVVCYFISLSKRGNAIHADEKIRSAAQEKLRSYYSWEASLTIIGLLVIGTTTTIYGYLVANCVPGMPPSSSSSSKKHKKEHSE